MAGGVTYKIRIDENGNVVLPSLIRNTEKADASLNSMARGGVNASQGITLLGRSANSASAGLGQMKGLLASIGFTLGAGVVVKNIIATGRAFEKSMSNVKAISGATEEEFVRLKQAARDAGAATIFSATDAADAMGFLAQAGFKTNQQIAAIPGTLDLAAASSLGMAQAADITASTLAQFGMKAEQSLVVADQFAFTTNNFNTNITELADAMKYFGPIAHSFNIPLAEANAVIGLVANSGLKGSMATRALSTALTRLSNPTKEMNEMMSALNVNFFDAKGNFVGFANMVSQVERATANLTMKQKQQALSTIFGTEALKDMNPLIAQGGDLIKEWTERIEKANGTAAEMAKVKTDNLYGDWEEMKSAAEEYTLTLYDGMQPALRGVTQEATRLVASLDAKAMGAALGGLAQGVFGLTKFVVQHKDAIIWLGKAYITAKIGMLAYNTVVRTASSLTAIFNKTILLSPWGLVLGGITAVVAGFALFSNRTKSVVNANQGAIDSIYKERTQVNLLSAELKKSETPLNRRIEIIEELKRISPGLVEGITAEALAYEDLTKNVKEYNRQKINEIALERKKGELAQLQEAAADAMLHRESLEARIPALIEGLFESAISNKWGHPSLFTSDEDKRKYEERARMAKAAALAQWDQDKIILERDIDPFFQIYANLGLQNEFANVTGKHFRAKKVEGEAMLLAENFMSALGDYSSKIAGSLDGGGGSGGGGEGSGVGTTIIPGAGIVSDNIVKGGTSQRIINVTVHKFQDTVNNYLDGSNEGVGGIDGFMDNMNEWFMRILNSANQLAR